MKKILSILAVVAVAGAAFAQGTVNFANNATTPVQFSTSLNGSSPTAVPTAGGSVQLLWAPAGTAATPWNNSNGQNLTQWLAANPGWQLLAGVTKALNAPGRFIGGTITIPTATPGGVVDAMLVAWTGSSTSFDQAYTLAAATPATAQVAISGKFTLDTANANALPVPETAAALTQAGGLSTATILTPVSVIPEPSTFALAGLGAAAMLIFRRRK